MQYEAKLRLAQADSESETRRAEGEKSRKMVDVQVERERVGVERERVEVERQELANRSEFEVAALEFELSKLRIAADKDARIAAAQALGQMLSKANMQIFGDPETMAKMSNRFMSAAGVGNSVDGFLRGLPPQARELVDKLNGKLGESLDGEKVVPGEPATSNGKH